MYQKIWFCSETLAPQPPGPQRLTAAAPFLFTPGRAHPLVVLQLLLRRHCSSTRRPMDPEPLSLRPEEEEGRLNPEDHLPLALALDHLGNPWAGSKRGVALLHLWTLSERWKLRPNPGSSYRSGGFPLQYYTALNRLHISTSPNPGSPYRSGGFPLQYYTALNQLHISTSPNPGSPYRSGGCPLEYYTALNRLHISTSP